MNKPLKAIPNLKARREAKGYSIPELSRIAGVHRETIKRAEAGHLIRDDNYRWIEDALNG